MQMITASQKKITLIQPGGHINASNAAEFQEYLTALVNQAQQDSVLVDLEQVESMDSAGLMALVHGLKLAQSLGKRFSLCSVSPSIKMIFELTGLDSVFEIIDSPATLEAAA